jgi:sulfopyruvate decarboxylase subunit alpha
MENTGFLVASYALEFVCRKYGIPVLLIMSDRGEFGDGVWWLAPFGERFHAILDTAGVRYTVLRRDEEVKEAIKDAIRTMNASKLPVALLFSGEVVF